MKPTNIQLIKAFNQGAANNCASIALIKAAIEVHGTDGVFKLTKNQQDYTAKLKNGAEVIFTQQELDLSIKVALFTPGLSEDAAEQLVYNEILLYAQKCFAVMVCMHQQINQEATFEKALNVLNNGANSNYISAFLGLEQYTTDRIRRMNPGEKGMIAWAQKPWLKHTVFMSQNVFDDDGSVSRNVSRFPKRIRLLEDKGQEMIGTTSGFSPLYFINVSQRGNFEETSSKGTLPVNIDQMFEHIKTQQINNLVVHVHGGLISENMGMTSAERFYENFKDLPDCHPVTFVWETGFLEALPETLLRLLQTDDFFKRLIKAAARILASRTGIDISAITEAFSGDSLVPLAKVFDDYERGGSLTRMKNAFGDLETMTESEQMDAIYEEVSLQVENYPLGDDEMERLRYNEDYLLETRAGVSFWWAVAKIVFRCVKRGMQNRDHGIWPTIIEEASREVYLDDFGTEMWSVMKKQAVTMWKSNANMSGVKQYAGRYFLDALKKHTDYNPDFRIHFVGHSAGAIVGCELLKMLAQERAAYSNITLSNLLFCAPACRCDLFEDSVMKYPDLYKQFRMFTMDDYHESRDNLIQLPVLKYLYTRSLLYLISGMLEGHDAKDADAFIVGLQRHIRNAVPYTKEALLKRVHEFVMLPQPYSNRVSFSTSAESAPDGWKTQAVHHGGFIKDADVVKSIRHLIQQ
jgi:hypothetical protein